MTTSHSKLGNQSHPVPGINVDINGNPMTAPTDKDSLGVGSDTPEFRLLMLAEHLSRGARLRMQDGEFWLFSEDGEGIQGGSIRDAVYGPDLEPTNWQARAEKAEAEVMRLEDKMRGSRMIQELSASQAEVERLRAAIKLVLEEKCPSYHDCTDDGEIECAWCVAMNSLSPAEKGGEG